MRNLTTLIQVLMVSGTAWILFLLWSSRQTAGNSVRVCPSCNGEIAKFDLVHCGNCLENKQNPAQGYKASKSSAVN